MSAHTRKHHTKNVKMLHIVYQGNIYNIPKKVADEYKVGSVKKTVSKIKRDSILADDLFAELDQKYTKAGVLLQGIRHREGLSQVQFAKVIKVTQSDLSKMERGKRPIGKIIAKRIANKFGIDYRMLLS